MRKVVVDAYDSNGARLYGTDSFSFDPGLTILVGCNGAGKTTLMTRIIEGLEREGVPSFKYYGTESEARLSEAARLRENTDLVRDYLLAQFRSEGEKSVSYFSMFLGQLRGFVREQCAGSSEGWVFIDSIDSGISIDVIQEIKGFLVDTVVETKPDGLVLYIIVSANSYEMAKECDCLDVQTGNHLGFENYDDYAAFVASTRRKKDSRQESASRGR